MHQGRLASLAVGRSPEKASKGYVNLFFQKGTNNLVAQDENGNNVVFLPQVINLNASLNGNVPTQILGAEVTSLTLNWGYNKDILSQTLNGNAIDVLLRQSILDFTNNPITTDSNFNISGNTDTENAGANFGIHFANHRFWGVGQPGITDPTQLIGGSDLADSKSVSFSANADASQKVYFARPARFGPATYSVGGFSGGFDETTVSVTNENGFTEDYIIGESTNKNLGQIIVNVS